MDGLELKPHRRSVRSAGVTVGRQTAAVRVHGVAGPRHDPGQVAVNAKTTRNRALTCRFVV